MSDSKNIVVSIAGIVLIANLFFLGEIHADTPDTLLVEANKYYEAGEYSKAADIYLKLLSTVYNGQILYNLGNCYFKQNQLANAIVYYERAARLQPRDSAIKSNLEVSRLLLKDEIKEPLPGMFTRITGYPLFVLSLNEWAIITSILYFVCMAFLILGILLLDSPFRRYSHGLSLVFGILAFVSFCYLGAEIYLDQFTHYGIIAVEATSLKSGPGEDYSSVTNIHTGAKVRIRHTRGEWIQVSLANGWNGWIHESDFINICEHDNH